MKKVYSLVLAMAVCLSLLAGCGGPAASSKPPASEPPASSGTETSQPPVSEPPVSLGKVRFAFHPGGSVNNAAFLIDQMHLNEKYNFEYEMVVTTGPNVYSSLAAGELDIGFLGNGMAWHYFEPNSKIAVLTLDNLTNDDRLIMRTGSGFGEDETLESLAEKLGGKTIACDLTTTPGTFLKSLVNAMNRDKADDQKLWYEDVEGAYPLKGLADKQITILNTTNANINSAMQDKSVDGCVTFGNVRVALERDTDNYVMASSTFKHLSDTITPSTWAVNKEFAEKNPELVQAFVNALVEGMEYRHDDSTYEERLQMAMAFDQLSREDYNPDAAYWPSKEDLKSYYATDDGMGFTYMEQIRASHMGSNGLEDATAPAARDVILVDFIRNATAD